MLIASLIFLVYCFLCLLLWSLCRIAARSDATEYAADSTSASVHYSAQATAPPHRSLAQEHALGLTHVR